jgi:hypothetical protein
MLVPGILGETEKIKESEKHRFWVPSWKVYHLNMIFDLYKGLFMKNITQIRQILIISSIR